MKLFIDTRGDGKVHVVDAKTVRKNALEAVCGGYVLQPNRKDVTRFLGTLHDVTCPECFHTIYQPTTSSR